MLGAKSPELIRDVPCSLLGAADESLPTESALAEQVSAERVWFIDPLDGTREFIAPNGEFSVMIGRARGRQVAMTCTMKAHVQRAQCEAALVGDGKNGVPNVEMHELTVGPPPSPERPLVVAQVAAATFGWRIATW